jgi:hypothetical protein
MFRILLCWRRRTLPWSESEEEEYIKKQSTKWSEVFKWQLLNWAMHLKIHVIELAFVIYINITHHLVA